ncbi:hypothetical protein PsYK624_120360 [Phanerochaete sordida]|uniref:Uncharacterized protein n=1 Tax=Phanerochaete sordida TaxID=48140 RepID=A0A9P3LHS9_9APHY|nr:hypothetical protein PsYK624_120360 [Phanerochaete sordida]
MAPGFLERNVTFWGLVGAVMVALKMKERYDDYEQVPGDEEGLGHGPVALHSPIDPERSRDLPHLEIDTEIPSARPKHKARKDCCVCCGLKCGLFWKAFGIVCAIFFGWQLIKFAIWLATPSPTGLEGMPAYSTSLGCANAKHVYNPGQTLYNIPIGANADTTIDISGGAYGTVLLAEGAADAQDIQLEMTLRTDNNALLDSVRMQYPQDSVTQSRVFLETPVVGSSCMRFDMVMRVPPALRDLKIIASSLTQVQFDKDARVALDSLVVTLASMDDSDKHMLLPAAGVRAKTLQLETRKGWLVGDVSIVDETSIFTNKGDAVLNVHVHPAPAAEPSPATLNTYTGSGRADVFYESDSGAPHRQIQSTHKSERKGDLYLTYKNAEFNGLVDVKARSSSTSGVQGMFNRTSNELPWVGNKDGGDKITASSSQGWIGLYF